MTGLPALHVEPAGVVAVVCFGFEADRVRRQPWHVAHGLADGCARLGHRVLLVTDAAAPPDGGGAYEVGRVPTLFRGGRPSGELRAALAAVVPARIFLICGALRLARLGPLDLGAPVTLVMTSPRLRAAELARLSPATWWREGGVLRGPLLDALVPGALLRRGFGRSRAAAVLYLSEAARVRYRLLGLPRGRVVAPQVAPEPLPPAPRGVRPRVVYLGPALEARGAWTALEAFEEAVRRGGLDGELLLLLRPDGGRAGLLRMLRRVRRSPFRGRIRCSTRMLAPETLRERLASCHVSLLPFKAPVSEVPLVVIEAGLSGRRVVALEAPGVGEYARRFGGLVAREAGELPDLLTRACLMPPARRPDPAEWTRWDRALAPVLGAGPHPFAVLGFVGLIGADGSGKTFLLDRLCASLAAEGVPHRRVWSRFRNYLSKPLLALARLTGHNVKVDHACGTRVGYHEFDRTPALGLLFLALQAADQLIDLALRYRGRRLVVGDRCVLDTLVDLAVDTGLDDLVIDQLGPTLVRLLPRPRLVVLVSRPAALVRRDRPDALLDRHFMRRRALYERLAARFGIPVVVNDAEPEAAVADILRLARRRDDDAATPPAGAGQP